MIPTPEVTISHPALDELAALGSVNPLDPMDRGRLIHLARTATMPEIQNAARRLLDAPVPGPVASPNLADPFAHLSRTPENRRRPLTGPEQALLVEASRRDDLTIEDALEIARLGAVANDEATTRLADLATRPVRAQVADELSSRRRAHAAAVRATLPPKAPQLSSAERQVVGKAVAKLVEPLIQAPDSVRHVAAGQYVFEQLAAAEHARDASYAVRRDGFTDDAA